METFYLLSYIGLGVAIGGGGIALTVFKTIKESRTFWCILALLFLFRVIVSFFQFSDPSLNFPQRFIVIGGIACFVLFVFCAIIIVSDKK